MLGEFNLDPPRFLLSGEPANHRKPITDYCFASAAGSLASAAGGAQAVSTIC
jgi:hypothetical protein